jgi:hypothetical protein
MTTIDNIINTTSEAGIDFATCNVWTGDDGEKYVSPAGYANPIPVASLTPEKQAQALARAEVLRSARKAQCTLDPAVVEKHKTWVGTRKAAGERIDIQTAHMWRQGCWGRDPYGM